MFSQCRQGMKEKFVLFGMSPVGQRVGDSSMKCVRGLSSFALMSFLSVQPGVAMSKVAEQAPNPTLSTQTQPMIIANPFGILRDTVRTVKQVDQIRVREQRRQEAERRRQEREVARQEAIEQQRLKAEQQRQYFESLSPEQKQAYVAEQRARQEQTARLLLMFFGAMSGNGAGSDQQDGGGSVSCLDGFDSNGSPIYRMHPRGSSRSSGSNCS